MVTASCRTLWRPCSDVGNTGTKVVVCPRERQAANAAVRERLLDLTSLIDWEIKIAAYEVASGDRISESVLAATTMDHALEPVKKDTLPRTAYSQNLDP